MKINKDIIDHIAHLSRLNFNGEEIQSIQNDLEKITDFMDKLNELNTDGIEPLIFMSEEINVLREDVAVVTISQDEGLKNAPKKDSDYFRIPKVLDK
jgi:aspartyl-tRNA(Asn)/glutamyl-tRNA(Gln) amidotransferase subunit C